MTRIEQFPYRDRNPTSGGVNLLPDLPITLRYQNKSVVGEGLVDSGATISVLPYSLGVQLGFDWNAQRRRSRSAERLRLFLLGVSWSRRMSGNCRL